MAIQSIGALKFSWFKSHHRYRSHPSSCSVAESLGCFFIGRELFCSVCADECYLISGWNSCGDWRTFWYFTRKERASNSNSLVGIERARKTIQTSGCIQPSLSVT